MCAETQVFVALLGEGTQVWRPVDSRKVSPNVFEILGPVPVGEEWEFQPGQIVECALNKFLQGDMGFIAVRVKGNI